MFSQNVGSDCFYPSPLLFGPSSSPCTQKQFHSWAIAGVSRSCVESSLLSVGRCLPNSSGAGRAGWVCGGPRGRENGSNSLPTLECFHRPARMAPHGLHRASRTLHPLPTLTACTLLQLTGLLLSLFPQGSTEQMLFCCFPPFFLVWFCLPSTRRRRFQCF